MGKPMQAASTSIVATCPRGMIPLGKGKPLAKCWAIANGPVEFGGVQATRAVSLSKRNLSCSSASTFGARRNTDGCVVFLPQGSGSFFSANPSSCLLPSCSDVAMGQSCNPDPSATNTLQDRSTFDLLCVTQSAVNGTQMQCSDRQITATVSCAKKVADQTLRRLRIDPTD